MPEMYSSLLEWRRAETTGRSLAKLPPDFFASTTRYLEQLKLSYEAELRENPSAKAGEIARQTYQRASQVARDILESRVQKVLTLAFQASVGAPRELPNSLPEERATFDQMLAVLLDHRHSAAPYLDPRSSTGERPAPRPPSAEPRPSSGPTAAAVAAPPRSVDAPPGAEYVRIVGEPRTIEVGAETIDLAADDVLTLPTETVRLLVEAKVAERLTTSHPSPRA